ncbi:hypothetical protein [uncultured Anaeromusa sp.]|uniref:hypothetical protein n=1 Tax=uncultured Anaeromusa sp. TaxID=673273 RepID=UPI0029C97E9A|nr:hypothetical protein [uncultured Anaeromusa sp.]
MSANEQSAQSGQVPKKNFSPGAAKTGKPEKTPPIDRPLKRKYLPILQKLEPEGYSINAKNQLTLIDDSGDKKPISDVLVVPVKFIKKLSRDNEEFFVEVIGSAKDGTDFPKITLTMNEFEQMNTLMQHWGPKARILPKKFYFTLVHDAAKILAQDLEAEVVYAYTGWQKTQGTWGFLHADGCVGIEDVRVELTPKLNVFRLPPEVRNMKAAVEASLDLLELAPYEITMFLWALTYLAPLCEAARQAAFEPKFVAWLYGRTGSMKTTLSMLFLNHFGPMENPPATFKDSLTAFECKAACLKDAVILFDDYHPVKNRKEQAEMQAKGIYIFRCYGDRISRDRGTPTATLQESIVPGGMALVTAEDVPPGGESDVARNIAVKMNQGDVDKAKLDTAQKNQELLAEAMHGYLSWLAPRMEKLPQKLGKQFQLLRGKMQKEVGGHKRTGDAIAWLCLGLRYGLQHALARKVLSKERAQEYYLKGKKVFLKLGKGQTAMVQGQQPVDIFLETLQILLDAKKLVLVPKSAQNPSRRGLGGYYDDHYFYLLDTVYQDVESYLRSSNQAVGATLKTLYEAMHQRQLICGEVEKPGTEHEKVNYKKKIMLGDGTRPRLLALKRSAIPYQPKSGETSFQDDE